MRQEFLPGEENLSKEHSEFYEKGGGGFSGGYEEEEWYINALYNALQGHLANGSSRVYRIS